eukprot:Rmarinus@m.15122
MMGGSKIEHFRVSDFVFLCRIGKGHLAEVWSARHVSLQKRLFAVKRIDKTHIRSDKQAEHVKNEKAILARLAHPFIVPLRGTMQDEKHLYFVLDLYTEATVWRYIHENGVMLETDARFLAACLVHALSYIHSEKAVYRDLKLTNVVFDVRGYPHLVDFEFAKFLGEEGRTFTDCGTETHLSPEVVAGKGFSPAADWWALGVVMYEVLVGGLPFPERDPAHPHGVYDKERKMHVAHPLYLPPCLSRPALSFLEQLLHPDAITHVELDIPFKLDAEICFTMYRNMLSPPVLSSLSVMSSLYFAIRIVD